MKASCLLVLVAVCLASAHDFKSCATIDHLHVSSVTLNPDPVLAGKDLLVYIDATPDVAISSGNVELDVSVFGVKIATVNFNICTDLGVTCPLAAGTSFNGTVKYTIPSEAPAGISANCKIIVTDGASDPLGCVAMDVKISKAAVEVVNPSEDDEKLFKAWMIQYSRSFTNEEYPTRLAVFTENHRQIVAHNSRKLPYTMAHNEFSHLTWDEFSSTRLGLSVPARDPTREVVDLSEVMTAPADIDWVVKGAVTDVKNQGQCGSCWAFSTTGSLEGAHFIKTGTLVALSEQELVDCDRKVDQGCNGGLMDNAFDWIASNGGLCSEGDYPYSATEGTCHSTSCTNVPNTAPSKHVDVAQTEAALEAAVALGPVSVAIEADQQGFQFYSAGVFTGTCGTQLDHGVLAVGYGTDPTGIKYWKVKNSWGASWGTHGYISLEKGKAQAGGQCGILMSASYPVL